jgi:hypothetical protein
MATGGSTFYFGVKGGELTINVFIVCIGKKD